MKNIAEVLNNIPKIVYWIPSILFLVVLLCKVLGGFRRGFRKTFILTIISIITLVVSYLLFVFIFKKDFFQEFLVKKLNLKDVLDVTTTNNTFNGVISAYIESNLRGNAKEIYPNFSEYTALITNLVTGFFYLILTVIVWQILYLLTYFFIYLPIFREGKYKKKKNKEYDEEGNVSTNLSKKQYKNRGYKKHRGFGSLIGLFRGVVAATFALFLFGFIYFGVSGGNKSNYDNETKITYNDKEYDLTPIYEALDNYDSDGVTYLLDRICVKGTPLYASFINLFSKTTITYEDGTSEVMYPYNELAALVSVSHDIIGIMSKYNININSEFLNQVDRLFKANDDLYNDLVNLTNSIKKSTLSDSLFKTLSNNFVSILDSLNVNNKYLNTIFKGDNAITLEDLITKDDYVRILDITKTSISIYTNYKESKDIKDIVINKSDEVITLVEKIQTLSVFNSDKSDKLNNIINELATEGISSIKVFQNVKFSGIDFVSSGDTTGEINKLCDIITNVLDSKMIVYENKDIKFNFAKISNVLNSNTSSISETKALRCIISGLISYESVAKYIYVPTGCYDTEGIIKTDDLKSLFNSLNQIVTNLEFSDENTYKASEIKNEIIPLTLDKIKDDETIIDPIYESTILKSIVAKSVYALIDKRGWSDDLASSLVLDDNNISTNIVNWTDEGAEVDLLLKTAVELYSADVISYNSASNEISYDLTNIYNLTKDDTSDLMNMATNSILLRSVLVSLLTKVISSDLLTIYVPVEAYETLDNNEKIITSSESVGLMKSLGVLCKNIDLQNGNIETMEDGVLDIIKNDISSLKLSYIFEATFSKVLYDALVKYDGDDIPYKLKLDNHNLDTNIVNWYGEDKEFENILDSLKILDIDSFSNYKTDTNVLLNNNTNINILLESNIIWYKFSNEIKNVESIAVTDASKVSDTDGTVYITKDEINKLIDSALAMDMSVLDDFVFNSTTISQASNVKTTIVSSRIIRDSISKEILMSDGATIYDTQGESSALCVEETTYNGSIFYSYTKDEVVNIIDGLGCIGIESVDIDFSLEKFMALTIIDKNKILSSQTLWYYVSNLILSNQTLSSVISTSNKEIHSILSYSNASYNISNESVVKKSYILSLS